MQPYTGVGIGNTDQQSSLLEIAPYEFATTVLAEAGRCLEISPSLF
jgi:hypothetical protein